MDAAVLTSIDTSQHSIERDVVEVAFAFVFFSLDTGKHAVLTLEGVAQFVFHAVTPKGIVGVALLSFGGIERIVDAGVYLVAAVGQQTSERRWNAVGRLEAVTCKCGFQGVGGNEREELDDGSCTFVDRVYEHEFAGSLEFFVVVAITYDVIYLLLADERYLTQLVDRGCVEVYGVETQFVELFVDEFSLIAVLLIIKYVVLNKSTPTHLSRAQLTDKQ